MAAIPKISSGTAVPAALQKIAPKPVIPQVDPKALELFSKSIVEDLKRWNSIVDTCYEFAKKASFDRTLTPPQLDLSFPPRPCEEERNFKSDLEDLMRYPDLVGWPETIDRRTQAQCSAFQLAYHNAFKTVYLQFGDINPLVFFTDIWENSSIDKRYEVLSTAHKRWGGCLHPNTQNKISFPWIFDALVYANLNLTAEEHAAFLMLTMDLRKSIKKDYDIVPLEAMKV